MAAVNLGSCPLGSLPTITLRFLDSSGHAVDPAQVKAQVTSGTTQTITAYSYPASIVRQSQGVYTLQPSCTESGLWQAVAYCPTGISGQTAQDMYWQVDQSAFPIGSR